VLLRRVVTVECCLVFLVLAAAEYPAVAAHAGEGFQPISPEELKMTSEPLAPGAPAIILYRQVDRDDSTRGTVHEDNYYRVKILTEEGRKYADIEISFLKNIDEVTHIRARTIKPDGSIVEFDGKVLEKSLLKARALKLMAKTFTLPAVEAGCIIEYSYRLDLKLAYDSHWILSQALFTKKARFSLKRFSGSYIPVTLRWSWQNLPPGADPEAGPDRIVRMEASNIAAFQTEDFMPPPDELKSRVDFVYETEPPENDPDRFWKRVGKQRNDRLEIFIGKRKAMEEAVTSIILPTDPPEVKLRKIYDRVQQIRNTTYESQKTAEEKKRENEKVEANVEDIWKRGYGDGGSLTLLYLALVQAAGFEAYGCLVSDRAHYFFNPKLMQSGKLDILAVLVKLNGKDLYFAPGAAFTPFGMLPWAETGTPGLRLDTDGGTWIKTTLPLSTESQIQRTAKLRLSESGDLEGKVTVTYTGLEAMHRRLEERNEDDVARKKTLEDGLKEQVPGEAEFELTNTPDWASTDPPLVAEMNIKIPGWASSAGKRTLLPVGFFSAHEKHVFEHANRVHPIYFEYPYQKVDDVTVDLPAGWQVSSVPPPQTQDGHVVAYNLNVENGNGAVHVIRKLNVDFLMLDQKYYGALRNFFQAVRSGDEQQIVLQPGTASASN
jgi:hypothetical protein